MLTVFASIVGFLGSILPEVFKFFKDRSEKAHFLKLLDKNLEKSKDEMLLRQMKMDLEEKRLMYEAYNCNKVSWIDYLNASVRPVLAYGFFIMYALMKYSEYKIFFQYKSNMEILEIWNENDQAIFAGIISFYFGQRTFTKMNR